MVSFMSTVIQWMKYQEYCEKPSTDRTSTQFHFAHIMLFLTMTGAALSVRMHFTYLVILDYS